MRIYSYGERDYAFGQAIVTLRTAIGLTQAGLAQFLGISRGAVLGWEAGRNYPKAERLKRFIALGVQQQAFAAGREEQEIRARWQAAHQKVLLDEQWLSSLLGQKPSPLTSVPPEPAEGTSASAMPAARPTPGRRVEWEEALDVPSFYGRQPELAALEQWVVQERCRVVSVLGMGGIGKSTLAVTLMHRVAEHFEVVLFYSLRDAPSCEALLENCLQVLSPQPLASLPASLQGRLSLLLERLRGRRALLVLDNLEALLQEGDVGGRYRPGYEGYGQLLRRVGETAHQSCLLLTSREKPADLVPLEGTRSPVRALRLSGLDAVACEQLLAEKGVVGTPEERGRLVETYAGNPLALKVVAEAIADLFAGEIGPFLKQGTVIFGGVLELLSEQVSRLSAVEQTVLRALAIAREPLDLEELLALLIAPLPQGQVLAAVDSLRRRSLIERGHRPGSVMLQSVVLEYVTGLLIEEATSEITQGRLSRLLEHGLCQAAAREDVRQRQERLIVAPLLARLRGAYPGRGEVEEHLLALLAQLRKRAEDAQGYGPANLLALLRELRGQLRGLDLSQLSLRGAYLQGVEMQDASLAGATFHDTVFTEAFDGTWAVAISRNGQYWAAGSRRGEVCVWHEGGQTLHLVWQAHTDTVSALAFGPDEHRLATGSGDGTITLWELERGAPLWTVWQPSSILSLVFAPDGRTLASSSANEALVRLWDAQSGTLRETLAHPGPVFAVAWSADGRTVASAGFDATILLWDVERGSYRAGLQGHSAPVYSIAFTPDSHHLLSGSEDGTMRVWDVARGQCMRIVQGHAVGLYSVAWSPGGTQVASAGSDRLVTVWDLIDGTQTTMLRDHGWPVYALEWSPDGKTLASSGWDNATRLWDAATGTCIQDLRGADHPDIVFRGVAWSPDGTRLTSSGEEGSLYVWDASNGTLLQTLEGHRGMVASVVWSPDGTRLASGGGSRGSGELFLWDAHSGERLHSCAGAPGRVLALGWSPRAELLVSGDSDGRLRWWDVQSGECMQMREAHQGAVQALRISPDGRLVASCGDDGAVMVWDLERAELLRMLRRDRPYERLNIMGVKGLTGAQKAALRALGAIEEGTLPL